MARARLVLLVFAASVVASSGCGGRQGTGPAWPDSAGSMVPDDWTEDGGESLAPDVPAEVAALEATEDAEEEAADEVAEAVVDEPAEATPATAMPGDEAPVELSPDEIFGEEEIIIEIE